MTTDKVYGCSELHKGVFNIFDSRKILKIHDNKFYYCFIEEKMLKG